MANQKAHFAHRFSCENCQFISDNKTHYDRHLLTAKHCRLTKTTNETKMSKNNNIDKNMFVCSCGNKYFHNSSFCKHKKNVLFKMDKSM